MAKEPLGINVSDAADERINFAFDSFEKIYVSFSAGKDSTVMLHMVAQEARRRGRKIGMLLVDLEGQYKHTIDHAENMINEYSDVLDVYWVCLPIALRNAVSMYEPKWKCWEKGREKDWIRQPSKYSITDVDYFDFFKDGMEFEEFVPKFGSWYADGKTCGCFVGIRANESLNRFRAVKRDDKACFQDKKYTTWVCDGVFNVYPLYDWKTEDIWTYHGKTGASYNKLYDVMHRAGLSIHQQRICQPYGDDQRKGLWLFHLIEPETWSRVVARVNGANSGALYSQNSGNITGTIKVTKPDGHTWESFARLLLGSMPEKTKDHFEDKITMFLRWWTDRGYPNGIPDEGPANSKEVPSWTRICKTLLRNDYWCKGLSFSQTKADSYDRYKKVMKRRRQQWNLI
jgi:predicted phosphoadenosine phosphosulfate sulfurtransferase